MPPREEFPAKKLEGAPSEDIGWHFGTQVPKHRNNIKCNLCGKVIKGGVTRLKQHIAHFKGQVAGCPRVTGLVRKSMMKLLLDRKEKKLDSKKRKDEFEARLRGDTNEEDLDDYIDEQVRQAKQASLSSQYEWEQRQHFRQQTRGSRNIYEQDGSSHASGSDASRLQDIDFNLRSTDDDLVRNRSAKQPKIIGRFMDAARKKLREAVGKFIISERVAMNKEEKEMEGGAYITGRLLTKPFWLFAPLAFFLPETISFLDTDLQTKSDEELASLKVALADLPVPLLSRFWAVIPPAAIVAAAEVGQGVKCPTPYEISTVCLKAEYNNMREWIKTLKRTWKETGVTIMCDGWTDSINHKHIMNFLVYSSKGTIFTNSIDVADVGSRNTDYYFQLLNKIVDEVGEEYVVQIVTYNEKAVKATGQKLMEKRPHLYWSACSAHCLDLCLEDIGKKKNVHKSLEEARMVTAFIYNHIWTVNLMKKYTGGREIVRPGITRFATKFLQLQEIVSQKQGNKCSTSKSSENLNFTNKRMGQHLKQGRLFWITTSKVFEPIVKVLRLVDGDTKPTMGFLYEAIDRAKQSIQKNCRYHSQYNDIIDKRWKFMHCDLHSAGMLV
ncbi:unnamed protein product [Lupinus luteus]|uniref:BED-type domain-containing protein n=1 Tax=Lupinus luteus TaxID=3873 RepID=A0AAV1WAU6_LUPLU